MKIVVASGQQTEYNIHCNFKKNKNYGGFYAKRLSFLVLLLAGLLISFTACSDDGGSTEPVPETPSGPATQAIPADPATETQAAQAATSNISMSVGMAESMSGSLSSGSIMIPGKKGWLKSSPPDWSADGDWWKYNGFTGTDSLNATYKIKFDPNIWATQIYPNYDFSVVNHFWFDYKLSEVEVEEEENGTTTTTDLSVAYTGDCQYESTAKTSVKGANTLSAGIKFSNAQMSLDMTYKWMNTFDGVSVSSQDDAMHCTFSCAYPYKYEATQTGIAVLYTAFTGEFKQDATGYGNLDTADQYLFGKIFTNNTLFVKYYKTPTGNYFTLRSESWGTHHQAK